MASSYGIMSASHRTRTGTQTTFNLSHPHPVIYDFADQSSYSIKITIPPASSWTCHYHWHETASTCETLVPLEGHYMISHFVISTGGSGVVEGGGPGFVMPLIPGWVVSWKRNPHWGSDEETVVFSLKINEGACEFYRQLCSVNQDAETYFRLATTPLWLRVMCAFWGWIPHLGPRMRAWLVEQLLWVQLRVIYAGNDYFEDEGVIPYTWPWWQRPAPVYPPDKWRDRERRSRVKVSRFVLKVCEWVGTKVLGMKASYEEYKADTMTSLWNDSKEEVL